MEYRFDEIAYNSTAKKIPEDSDRQYYIGLEHLDTNCLYVSRWGSDVTPVGEKLLMKKGDVLFGKRRAYQRKVGIAPFDGIFSAHGMVLRPKENVMDKNFFPFFISSDQFMERAVRISVGGLSPTINWKDLKEQVFDIPTLEEQEALASKLWAAYKLREEYKRLLVATDELVKSRFIELFCSFEKYLPLSEWIGITFPGEWGNDDVDGTGVKVIRTTNFTNSGKLDLSNVVTRDIDANKVQKKQLRPGDIILERSGGTADNPVGRVVYFEADGVFLFNNFTQLLRCKEGVNSLYVFYSLFNYYQTHKNEIRSMGNKTTGIQNLKMDKYWEIPIADAPKERQEEFVSLYRQADKSKFSDFKSRFIEMFGNPVTNTKKWSTEPLEIVAPESPSEERELGQVWILNLDMVESQSGRVIEKVYDCSDNLNSVSPFDKGNVLFSKLRPYLNKVVIPDGNGYATTELVPLRPKETKVKRTFLAYLLRSDEFVGFADSIATGTKMPRMPMQALRSFECILPPIQLQEEFIEVAEQADKSKFELKQAIEKIDKVMRALMQ